MANCSGFSFKTCDFRSVRGFTSYRWKKCAFRSFLIRRYFKYDEWNWLWRCSGPRRALNRILRVGQRKLFRLKGAGISPVSGWLYIISIHIISPWRFRKTSPSCDSFSCSILCIPLSRRFMTMGFPPVLRIINNHPIGEDFQGKCFVWVMMGISCWYIYIYI